MTWQQAGSEAPQQSLPLVSAQLDPHPAPRPVDYKELVARLTVLAANKGTPKVTLEELIQLYKRDELRTMLKENGLSYHRPGGRHSNQMQNKGEMAQQLFGLIAAGRIESLNHVAVEADGLQPEPQHPEGDEMEMGIGQLRARIAQHEEELEVALTSQLQLPIAQLQTEFNSSTLEAPQPLVTTYETAVYPAGAPQRKQLVPKSLTNDLSWLARNGWPAHPLECTDQWAEPSAAQPWCQVAFV